jgi:hypothetical protein
MVSFFSHRWSALLGTVLPLLALGLLPVVAKAECGDYVTSGKDTASQHVPMSQTPTDVPAKPCNGPLCRQHHDLPVAPTAPAPTTTSNDLIGAISGVQNPPALGFSRAALISYGSPVARPADIFHPPRLA